MPLRLAILTISDAGSRGENPATKDECKNGGWVIFGFANQGQCVRFVQTGKRQQVGRGLATGNRPILSRSRGEVSVSES